MKDKPILFSGAMVRALLAGTKTQTRRVVKPQPMGSPARWVEGFPAVWMPESNSGKTGIFGVGGLTCPYGQPGDRLWVRETFAVQPSDDCSFGEAMMGKKLTVSYAAGGPEKRLMGGEFNDPGFHADFAAADYDSCKYGINRPSIHMPRWASRINLGITGIQVERLQDISEADAIAEGITPDNFNADKTWSNAVGCYRLLWESINGPGSWEANPWVWVVEFKRVEGGAA